jgi:hypothetical protein
MIAFKSGIAAITLGYKCAHNNLTWEINYYVGRNFASVLATKHSNPRVEKILHCFAESSSWGRERANLDFRFRGNHSNAAGEKAEDK